MRLLILASLIASSACGPPVRCDEAAAAQTCPDGQESLFGVEDDCADRYEGACGQAWADHVACMADEGPACYDRAADEYTQTNECWGPTFDAYAACLCEDERAHGATDSPWCGI